MRLTKTPPRLKVSKTLSHPVDPAVVLGFEGRNIMLGVDCLVLKAETLPVIREQPSVTHFVIPEKESWRSIEENLHVYILDEGDVYYATPLEVEDSILHTGRKFGEDVDGRAVEVAEMASWPRGAVEVTN